MTRLTVLTMGAAMIGFCGFASGIAVAQTLAACPGHEAVVYFAPDSAALNAEQSFALVRMVQAARTCGADSVVVQANGDVRRADAVATALRQRGVNAIIIDQPALALSGDTMISRSVTLRVASPENVNT